MCLGITFVIAGQLEFGIEIFKRLRFLNQFLMIFILKDTQIKGDNYE